jgi:hypothetical protein
MALWYVWYGIHGMARHGIVIVHLAWRWMVIAPGVCCIDSSKQQAGWNTKVRSINQSMNQSRQTTLLRPALAQLTLRRTRRPPLDPLAASDLLLPLCNITQHLAPNRLASMLLRLRRRAPTHRRL